MSRSKLRGIKPDFANNSAVSNGVAVYFSAFGKTLTLTGNLFYENTGDSGYPVVRSYCGVTASYNVVDAAFGTESSQAGWYVGTGGCLFPSA